MNDSLHLQPHTRFFVFITLALLGFTLRIFHTPPHGGDTVSNMIRIDSIVKNGEIGWFLSFLSFFGWYPFSYPTGVHTVIATFVLISDLSSLNSVIIFSYFQSIFAFLTLYTFSHNFFKREIECIFAASFFCFSLYFVTATWNIITARTLFVIFYPLLFNSLIIILNPLTQRRESHIFLFLIFFVTLSSLHRIILFFMIIIISSILVASFLNYSYGLKKIFSNKLTRPLLLFIFAVAFLIQFSQYGLYENLRETYSTFIYGSFDSPLSILVNVFSTYGTYYGFIVTIIPFGVIYFILSISRSFPKDLMVLISFFSLFFILDIEYFLVFFSAFIGILLIKGIHFILDLESSNLRKISSFLIAIPSFFYLSFYLNYAAYLPLLISTLLLTFFTYKIYSGNNRRSAISVTFAVLLICLNSVFVSVPLKNLQIYDDSDSYSGKYNVHGRSVSHSIWLTYSTEGDFIASNSNLRNYLWYFSDKETAANWLEVYDFKLLDSELEVDLELSLLWSSGQKVFNEDIPSRYNPKFVEGQIFYDSNVQLLAMYEVSTIAIDYTTQDKCSVNDNCYNYRFFISTVENDKYAIFADSDVRFFHNYGY